MITTLIQNSQFIIMITNVSVNIIHIFRTLWVLLAKRKTACFEFRKRI